MCEVRVQPNIERLVVGLGKVNWWRWPVEYSADAKGLHMEKCVLHLLWTPSNEKMTHPDQVVCLPPPPGAMSVHSADRASNFGYCLSVRGRSQGLGNDLQVCGTPSWSVEVLLGEGSGVDL